MAHRILPVVAALALGFCLSSCGEDENKPCRVGSDCPSGICLSNGTCALKIRADAGPDAGNISLPDGGPTPDTGGVIDPADASGSSVDSGPGPDTGLAPQPDASTPDASAQSPDTGGVVEPPDAAMPPDAATPSCLPNNDGVITKTELPIVVGAGLTMRVAQSVTFDTRGIVRPDGKRVWDLSGAFTGDRDVRLETKPVTGQWFAASFPNGDYTVRMSGSADTLGIMKIAPDQLQLQGMASPTDGAEKTNLVYDKPIPTLAWPLQNGTEWGGKGIIDGYFEGTRYHCDDVFPINCTPVGNCCIRHNYSSKVDAAGELITPYGTFPVLRVKTVILYEGEYYYVWSKLRTVRAYAFVTECLGTVAVIVSKDDESAEEFTEAAEIRRIAP